MSETALKLKSVSTLNEGESIIQIMPFGANGFACLTSTSRVLVPGPNYGEWFELPVPPSFSSTG